MGPEKPGAERRDLDHKHTGESWTGPFLLWASVSTSVKWVGGLHHWISYAHADHKGSLEGSLYIPDLIPRRFQFSWSRNLYIFLKSPLCFLKVPNGRFPISKPKNCQSLFMSRILGVILLPLSPPTQASVI